jgi:hypothetical protein
MAPILELERRHHARKRELADHIGFFIRIPDRAAGSDRDRERLFAARRAEVFQISRRGHPADAATLGEPQRAVRSGNDAGRFRRLVGGISRRNDELAGRERTLVGTRRSGS